MALEWSDDYARALERAEAAENTQKCTMQELIRVAESRADMQEKWQAAEAKVAELEKRSNNDAYEYYRQQIEALAGTIYKLNVARETAESALSAEQAVTAELRKKLDGIYQLLNAPKSAWQIIHAIRNECYRARQKDPQS